MEAGASEVGLLVEQSCVQSAGEQIEGLQRDASISFTGEMVSWGLCEGVSGGSSTGIPTPVRCSFKRAPHSNGSDEVSVGNANC